MSFHSTVATGDRDKKSFLRIAIPSWGSSRSDNGPEDEASVPRREDFQELLQGAMTAPDLVQLKPTRSQARRRAIARKVQRVLCDQGAAARDFRSSST